MYDHSYRKLLKTHFHITRKQLPFLKTCMLSKALAFFILKTVHFKQHALVIFNPTNDYYGVIHAPQVS